MCKKSKLCCILLCVVFFSAYITSCNKIETQSENITVLHPFQIINISQTDTLLAHQGAVSLLVHKGDKIKIDFPAKYQNSGYNWVVNIVLTNDEVITEIPFEFQIDNDGKYIGLMNLKAIGTNNGITAVQSVELEMRLVK